MCKMTEVYTHQDMISMAEEAVSALRSTSDVDAVHDIKKLQDTLRAQYERAQFEFRETLKSTTSDLLGTPETPLFSPCTAC